MTNKKAVIARKKRYATAKKASIKAAIADNYLTVKQAAEWLKMSASHIYFLVHKKQIPFLKLGGKVLFDRGKVKDWVDSNSKAPLPFARKARKKKEQYYDIGTNQMVDAPTKKEEVTYEGAKRFIDSLNELTAPKPDKAREVKKIVSKAREIRKPGEKWKDSVKRAALEVRKPDIAPNPLTAANLTTVMEVGRLEFQILRSGKEITILSEMDGDPIDLSAGICSIMMKKPEYRKIFETGVYMYQRFQKS